MTENELNYYYIDNSGLKLWVVYFSLDCYQFFLH